MHASSNGYVQVMELLLKAGANVNLKNNYGGTALIHASNKGHDKVVNLLLKAGADANLHDKSGWTARIYASDKGHTEVVELLRSRLLLLIQRLLTPLSLLLTPLLRTLQRKMSLALHLALDSILLSLSAPMHSFSPLFPFKLK
jgi:ankyrin repeat protein